MHTLNGKVVSFRPSDLQSLPEDVSLALALIAGGVADFHTYIAEQRKKNSVTLDSCVAVDSSMQALLRVLRDDRLRAQLVHILSNARLCQAPESN